MPEKEKECNICHAIVSEYVDGRMKGRSQWAWMCMKCWAKYGIGTFGTGFAQRYIEGKKVEG